MKWTFIFLSSRTWRFLLNAIWQSGWEGDLEENGHMDMYGWVPLMFTWDYQNTVGWLYLNTKINSCKKQKRNDIFQILCYSSVLKMLCFPVIYYLIINKYSLLFIKKNMEFPKLDKSSVRGNSEGNWMKGKHTKDPFTSGIWDFSSFSLDKRNPVCSFNSSDLSLIIKS